MTRQERKARRRELDDRLARVDAELGNRLDDWDRPRPPAHLFGSVRVVVDADVMIGHA